MGGGWVWVCVCAVCCGVCVEVVVWCSHVCRIFLLLESGSFLFACRGVERITLDQGVFRGKIS